MTYKLWIYTTQQLRMLRHFYPAARQLSSEVYEVTDNDFSGTQDAAGDLFRVTFTEVS